MVCCIVYGELEPILSLRLLDYNLTDSQTGLIFGIQPFTYCVGTFLTPWLIPKWVDYRVTMISALLLCGLTTTLVGPFFEETNLVSMCIGLGFSGFLMGFLCIPNLPEMMRANREIHPDCDLEQANSLLSGLIMAGFGVG